jgi:putative flippase GtrA
MITKKGVIRFSKSTGIGIGTFSLDLLLLSAFIDVLHIHYLISAGVAFVMAMSLNYVISRRYVFPESTRSVYIGYALFLLIGGTGLFLVTALMYIYVDVLHLHYLMSRILTAGVVGWWNYLMNLYVNFKVVEK